ncbi:MAG: DUF4349 domain-containing protein [Solirubrobacteraceae bacterium]
MRLSEDQPLHPDVRAELEAIDATLRGEPVDPMHAELAELALLVAAERPQMPAEAAEALDAKIARRFVPLSAGPQAGGSERALAAGRSGTGGGRGAARSRTSRVGTWMRRPAFGIGVAAAVTACAVAGFVVLHSGSVEPGGVSHLVAQAATTVSSASSSATVSTGSTSSAAPPSERKGTPQRALSAAPAAAGASSGTGAGTNSGAPSVATPAPVGSPTSQVGQPCSLGTPGCENGKQTANLFGVGSPTSSGSQSSGSASNSGSSSSGGSSTGPTTTAPSTAGSSQEVQPPATFAPTAAAPTPLPNGRKTVQSAQLQLMAAASRIDQVSQELFNIVGDESGIVKSSTITSGSGADGYASFQLGIPSGNLADTMRLLSELPYAHVVSRTDESQDVNDQYLSDVRAVADAQALHTALLKQLENAYTQAQIDSLTAQIKDAEATIAADESTLGSLNGRIAFSPLQVQINAGTVIVPPPSSGSASGFTLGRAWHDALRVLTVAAGVGLIALAALLPIAVVVALLAWILHLLRTYRREAALRSA